MNRSIKRISIAALVMFLVLLVNVNYLQGCRRPAWRTGRSTTAAEYEQNQVQRGNIVTADGVTIASTKPTNDLFKYQRVYPGGPVYAPVTGYDTVFSQSQAPNYATGVERAENALLSGTGSELAFRNFIDMITNKPQKGATVELTINSKAQQAAYDELLQAAPGQDHQRQAAGRRRGRDQPGDRRHPGDGLLPELRPQPARRARHRPAERDRRRAQRARTPARC